MADEAIIPGVGTADAGGGTAVIDPPAPAEEVVETPAVEGAEPPAPETPAPVDGEKPADGEETPDPVAEYETDGRKIDAKTRGAIAELKKTNPQAAKQLADVYFRTQAYQREFATVQDARNAKATLEAVGGESGIEELNTELTDWRAEAEQFAAGDVALIEKLYEANPEALVSSTQNSLTTLQGKDSKLFDQAIVPFLDARLEKAGFDSSLTALASLIKEGKGQEAYDLVNKIGEWRAGMRDMAKKSGEARSAKNPEAEALAADRSKFQQEKAEFHDRTISNEVTKSNNLALAPVVEPLFKTLKLSNDGRREFLNALNSRIWAAMKADKVFQRNAHTMKGKGDASKTAEFISAKFTELVPDHFRRLRNAMYPTLPAAPPVGTKEIKKPAPPVNGKPAVTSLDGQKPKREDVDWSKTDDAQWIAGKGVTLRNGKIVNFKWANV